MENNKWRNVNNGTMCYVNMHSFQLQLQMLSIAYTDDFSGPGRAVDPVCVCVCFGAITF